MIKAEIVAHSKTKQGHELISYVLDYPIIIHAEVMTHRMFSRNAASARAIPYLKYRDTLAENLFIPKAWQKNHSGMQGTEYLSKEEQKLCDDIWKSAFGYAVDHADQLVLGQEATKQLANRLLHPFAYIRVLVTTGVDEGLKNFFELRNHEDAEIHIQELAQKMQQEYLISTPSQLQPGGWHYPFKREVAKAFIDSLNTVEQVRHFMDNTQLPEFKETLIKIATGMAARTSYTLFPEERGSETYIRIHDKMVNSVPFHASPFEHSLRSMTDEEYELFVKVRMKADYPGGNSYVVSEKGWCDNFRGAISYRYLLANNLNIAG